MMMKLELSKQVLKDIIKEKVLVEDWDEKIKSVYKVFQEHFEEANTDLQLWYGKSSMNFDVYLEDKELLAGALLNMWISRTTVREAGDPYWNRGNFGPYSILSQLDEDILADYLVWLTSQYGFATKLASWFMSNPIMTIVIHWNNVEIKNERDATHTIHDLYCKVPVTIKGTIKDGFLLKKTSFTKGELLVGYSHSHLPRSLWKPDSEWSTSCLGSGPIQHTIACLLSSFDLLRWGLFCYELDKYVHVESLDGGPYIRMAEIPDSSGRSEANKYYTPLSDMRIEYRAQPFSGHVKDMFILPFTQYYIENLTLPFIRHTGRIIPGFSIAEYVIDITNKAFHFAEQHQLDEDFNLSDLCIKAKMHYEELCKVEQYSSYSNNNLQYALSHRGDQVAVFRHKPVLYKILDHVEQELNTNNEFDILSPSITTYILNKILDILNTEYGRKDTVSQEG